MFSWRNPIALSMPLDSSPSAEPFDVEGEEKPLPWVEGWRCAYDMKTGQFLDPPDFADHNAQTVKLSDRRTQ
jgi:hypothetical protein